MELIKISKSPTNSNIAIVAFRDASSIVGTTEVRLLLSSIGEISHNGRTLTVVHPAGEYTFKPSEVDDIEGNLWPTPTTPWDFPAFYGHILAFLGWA